VAGNAIVSVRTPARKNHVRKLRRGLNWLRLWSSDGFVMDDNDALAGFVRGANIFSRAERHMIRRVPVVWSLAVCSTMPLQVTQTLIDIVIEHVDFHVPCLICTTVFKLSCLYVVRKPFEEIFAVVRRQNVLSRSTHKALWFQR